MAETTQPVRLISTDESMQQIWEALFAIVFAAEELGLDTALNKYQNTKTGLGAHEYARMSLFGAIADECECDEQATIEAIFDSFGGECGQA